MKSSVLPESYLRMMSATDREAIGQATASEVMAKGPAKDEKDLQRQIVQDLHRRGFEVCWHATHKKSTATKGWPDITFSHYGRSVAWECKLPTGRLSPEQAQMLQKLENKPNNWTVAVVRSFDEYLAELYKLYVGNPDCAGANTQGDRQ